MESLLRAELLQPFRPRPKETDGPSVFTRETWTSPDMQIQMLVKIHDPRGRDLTLDLQNLSRAEPDGSLFAPPADYKIVDENGEFTVTWGTPPPALAPPPPPPVPVSQGISGGGYRIGGGVSAPVPIYQPAPEYTAGGAAGGDSRRGFTEYRGRRERTGAGNTRYPFARSGAGPEGD